MKIVFSKQKLLDKLYPAMGTVSTKNTIPSIEGVLIETLGQNKVRLSTYDMNKGVRATLEAEDVIEEGSYIINASRLLSILKVLSGDTVTIEVDENFHAKISAGQWINLAASMLNIPMVKAAKNEAVGRFNEVCVIR